MQRILLLPPPLVQSNISVLAFWMPLKMSDIPLWTLTRDDSYVGQEQIVYTGEPDNGGHGRGRAGAGMNRNRKGCCDSYQEGTNDKRTRMCVCARKSISAPEGFYSLMWAPLRSSHRAQDMLLICQSSIQFPWHFHVSLICNAVRCW